MLSNIPGLFRHTQKRRCFSPCTFYSTVSHNKTLLSVLPNGVKVASLPEASHFVATGVYVNAGTRHQSPDSVGVCHILDRMSFKETKDYTSEQLVQTLEKLGGNVMAHSSRESMSYQATVFPQDLPTMLKIFAQIVRHPKLLPHEIEETKESTKYELQEFGRNLEMKCPELLHHAAFEGGLGYSLVCEEDQIDSISMDQLLDFREKWYTPQNIVVAGVGMKHDELVELANQTFGDMMVTESPPIPSSKYTGGTLIIPNFEPPINPDIPLLTHIYITFQSLSSTDNDIYSLATLSSLMGGGGSFSAGGPGKGMHTRLYTQVLNRHYWVENCAMTNLSYSDTGIFGMNFSINPYHNSHSRVADVMISQLVGMQKVNQEELNRAKKQLMSSLLMGLESKMVQIEDIGRQCLAGKFTSVEEMCQRIEMVEEQDIARVVRRVVFGSKEMSRFDFNGCGHTETGGQPTILVHGPVRNGDALYDLERKLKFAGVGSDWEVGKTEGRGSWMQRILGR